MISEKTTYVNKKCLIFYVPQVKNRLNFLFLLRPFKKIASSSLIAQALYHSSSEVAITVHYVYDVTNRSLFLKYNILISPQTKLAGEL